jgi:predicted nucleotidyltransferase
MLRVGTGVRQENLIERALHVSHYLEDVIGREVDLVARRKRAKC